MEKSIIPSFRRKHNPRQMPRRSRRLLIFEKDLLYWFLLYYRDAFPALWNHDRKEHADMEITKETTMGAMLEYDMGIAYVLIQAGMHCVGCPSSIGESLEEACAVHGLDADVVLASIQEYLNGQG